ncbi:MAG: tetratricopeptide repeat protein [Treponema sp.]|jgi:tetratricopeptide (TPR) repeat protein|nr:tetratricopeptide repeat protein [Treponema sp.]
MLRDPLLNKALRLSKMGKYDESIKLLEAEVFRYQDSYNYYHILGNICLHAGDFGGAHTYFTRAKNIRFREPANLLGLAALFLRRAETDRALDLYLDVQDLEPKNKTAKRALRVIRKYGGTDEFSAWLIRGKLTSLYPPLPWAGIPLKPLPLIIAGIAIVVVLAAALGIKNIPVFQRSGYEEGALEKTERDSPVETEGLYRYVFTGQQVLSMYQNARELFNKHRDEAAKRELNRILESNASRAIKNKARLLREYTEPPGFDTLKDHFSYAEVAADPLLYRDCHVLWRGSAANLRTGPNTVSFEFLVGYDTRIVMEGAVLVELDFPAEINTIEPLEVLGRVVPLSVDKFMIAGTGIHQSPALLGGPAKPGGSKN